MCCNINYVLLYAVTFATEVRAWEKSKRWRGNGMGVLYQTWLLDLNVQFLFQISNSFFTVHDSLWWTLYRCVFSNGGKAWDEWAVGVLYQSFLISSKINNFFLSIVHVLHIAEVYLTNILPPVLVTFPFGFTLKYTKYTKYIKYTIYNT